MFEREKDRMNERMRENERERERESHLFVVLTYEKAPLTGSVWASLLRPGLRVFLVMSCQCFCPPSRAIALFLSSIILIKNEWHEIITFKLLRRFPIPPKQLSKSVLLFSHEC